MNKLWDNITEKEVLKAIELFDTTRERYPEPRNTFLIYNNKKYPAKHIRGLAYLVANNKEISKNDYSGGQETANFFRKLGFKVEYEKSTLKPKTVTKNTPNVSGLEKPDEKRVIKRLNAVSQKNALQKLLQKHFGHIETEKKFDWLKTPNHDNLPEEYREIVSALSKYRNQNGFQKSNYQLLCDIVLDDQKLIVEYDENQHFSKARKITLENYSPSIQLNYAKQAWIMACDKISARDNNPVDRDEKRAYYDTVRDIEAFKHGYRLIRIMHGEFDWEAIGAEKYLSKLLTNNNSDTNARFGKHKIARLIVTGKEYDKDGNPDYIMLEKLIETFISKVYMKQQFEFILTAGGFLTFEFPESLRYNIDISEAEDKKVFLFQSEANLVITNFFKNLPKDSYEKLKKIADYFTLGIDGFNPINRQKIELVAVYNLKLEKVIWWTGKFYPRSEEERTLVKIKDLTTHFLVLNNQNIAILGCHDLNVYSPRGQANANPEGWKKMTAVRFKKLCNQFNPDIILQHPHTTDTPITWNVAWRTVEKELPNVRHFASGIKYFNKNGVRGDLNKVLEKTKKGDVVDFYLDY